MNADTLIAKYGCGKIKGTLPLRDRFDAKWTLEPNTGCWIWTGSARAVKPGYLQYGELVLQKNYEQKHFLAHRISWMLRKGEIPDGMDVLHRCDVPLCVNPDHLFLGTQKDNVTDMIQKGRKFVARGERAGSAKLKEHEVIEILNSYVPGKVRCKSDYGICGLARRFNVSKQCISAIVKRQWWRHVSTKAYEVSDAEGKAKLEELANG